jgi:hypothetical protein
MKLTEHFELEEMIRSAAHPDIKNSPTQLQIVNLEDLCTVILEPIRKKFSLPITVLSGFRSPELNKAVGGAANSQHLAGEAADINIYGVSNCEVWQFIVDFLSFDQCIAEHLKEEDGSAGWVHVSYRMGKNRREPLSCIAKGVYVKGLQWAD